MIATRTPLYGGPNRLVSRQTGDAGLYTNLGNNPTIFNYVSRTNTLGSTYIAAPMMSPTMFPVVCPGLDAKTPYDPSWFGSQLSQMEYQMIIGELNDMAHSFDGEAYAKRNLAKDTGTTLKLPQSDQRGLKIISIIFLIIGLCFLIPGIIFLAVLGIAALGAPFVGIGGMLTVMGLMLGLSACCGGPDLATKNPIAFCNHVQLQCVEINQRLMPRGLYLMVHHLCYKNTCAFDDPNFALFYVFLRIPNQESPVVIEGAKALLASPRSLIDSAKYSASVLATVHTTVPMIFLYSAPEAAIANAQRAKCRLSIAESVEGRKFSDDEVRMTTMDQRNMGTVSVPGVGHHSPVAGMMGSPMAPVASAPTIGGNADFSYSPML
ncbi:hypothetical protein ADUPG1_012157 [Aduncisulcus paluster]|uniref:Uncharacterized protein n=1 Tax=Aduncisulcus paluster TaxID=2918883 RepID=A0ABQ5K2P0_9EUKA|nr:hypothetical protein ADUPG1_012157 [Aduncisulcus paluster]